MVALTLYAWLAKWSCQSALREAVLVAGDSSRFEALAPISWGGAAKGSARDSTPFLNPKRRRASSSAALSPR